jgi:hypothetical protein
MNRTDHFLLKPNADFKRFPGKVRQTMDIYIIAERYKRHFDGLAEQGDLPVAINKACTP